jgi:hypothetical protein
MAKTRKDIQKAFRERQGENLKAKEKERSKLRRRQKNKEKKEYEYKQSQERLKKFRLKRKGSRVVENVVETQDVFKHPYGSQSSETRATNKVIQVLPNSPSKRQRVVTNLIGRFLSSSKSPSLLQKKKREKLSQEVRTAIHDHYHSDEVSRCAPGRKDCKKVIIDGIASVQQIRHMICSIRETYYQFTQTNGRLVSLAKFAKLKPPYILPMSNMPHNVCVCREHQNFISLCDAIGGVFDSPKYDSMWVEKEILCDPPTENECLTGTCHQCSNGKLFRERHTQIFDEMMKSTDPIRYTCWGEDERGFLERQKIRTTVQQALQTFSIALPGFILHHLTKRHQARMYREHCSISKTVPFGIVVHFDYSENYTCLAQDEIQSSHWNNPQVTLFTVAVFSTSGFQSELLVSDCKDHTKQSAVVYIFDVLKRWAKPGMHVQLWSDGPSSQFKNRYMYHALGIFCEKLHLKAISWNFFCAAHGKGCVDGIGGTAKRMVWQLVKSRLASVKNAREFALAMIMKPEAKINVHVISNPLQLYNDMWNNDLSSAIKINGIKSDHCWLAVASNISRFSLTPIQWQLEGSNHETCFAVDVMSTSSPKNPEMCGKSNVSSFTNPSLHDFVLVRLDASTKRKSYYVYFVGTILERENRGWMVKCMRRYRSSFSKFVYPSCDDISCFDNADIIRILSPPNVIRSVHYFLDDLSCYKSALH